MIAAAAFLTLSASQNGLPTVHEVDLARTQRIHQCFGDDGMVHCRRFRNLRCSFVSGDRRLARCRYREWAEAGPWPVKWITLRREGAGWHWVEGDPPRCSITVFTDD